MIDTGMWAERSGSESAVLHRGTELLRGLELSPGIRAHLSILVKTVLAPLVFFAVNKSTSVFHQGK